MTRLTRALLCTGARKDRDNIVWNMIGSFCYALASMVLSFLVIRIIGGLEGGIFAFGFSVFGQHMFLLAYFGIRPYQITDLKGEFSFGDYLHHRMLTCGAAVVGGGLYLLLGVYLRPDIYSPYKAIVIFLLVWYKVIDGFADVYEAEFQRNGNLHLTGKSNTFRTLLTVGIFLISLLVCRNLLLSCVLAVLFQGLGVRLFDIMVLRELTGVERAWQPAHRKGIFLNTTLLFVSVFLDFYIFSASKYAINAHMNDVYSGYYSTIFMPTSMINLVAGFVIRPFLSYLTEYWNQKRYDEFLNMIRKLTFLIAGLWILAVGAAWLLGYQILELFEWLLGDTYTNMLTGYHKSFILIIAGGGCYACLNLFYYVLVILRKQKLIFMLYLILAGLALVLTPSFVIKNGLYGAAEAYLLLMILMAAAFILSACMTFFSEKSKK